MKLLVENIELELKGNFADDMSDEEFLNFCEQNRDLRIERNANNQIYIMSPVNSFGGSQNADISADLTIWNRTSKLGICFDSSAGFTLADGAVFSPAASWMPIEKWYGLSETDKQKFAPACPDFIIELRSKTDNIKSLKDKMLKWIENGAKLGWLIDTAKQQTYIYRTNCSVELIDGFDKKLSGENILVGFELDLNILK